MKQLLIALATSIVLTASVAQASSAKPERALGVDASIPFANSIGINDYKADGNQALWIQDQRRNWYRAELMGSCTGLDFAQRIGFITRGTSTFDKFSQILVDGRTCQVDSLVTSAGPPLKAKNVKKEDSAA
jgi:hypothetical protein